MSRARTSDPFTAQSARAPEGGLHRGVEAQQLVHGRGHETGVAPEPGELVRVGEQRQHSVTDQIGGGLVAGDQQEPQEVQHLALAEALAAVLGVGQRAQDVVAGRTPALGDERPEIRVERLLRVLGDGALAEARRRLQQPGALRRPELEAVPVLRRDAQHLGDDDDRQGLPGGSVARMNSTVPGHSTSTSGA